MVCAHIFSAALFFSLSLVLLAEDDFLSAILRETQAERVHFKLAPAYVIYMCCRYRVSPHYRTGIRPEERNRRLAEFLTKVIGRMHVTIQVRQNPDLRFLSRSTTFAF